MYEIRNDNTPEVSRSLEKKHKRSWPLALIVLGMALVALSCFADPYGKYGDLLGVVLILGLCFFALGLVVYLVLNWAGMSMPKKVALGIATFLAVLAFLGMLFFWISLGGYYDLRHYRYDDDWIIGRSIAEVETRYGKTQYLGGNAYGYFLYKEDTGLDPRFIDINYAMFIDESGVVISVDAEFTGFGT